MERKGRGRSFKHNKEGAQSPPPGYVKCKHRQCSVYCEDEEAQRRHMEDFKFHRHHYEQLGGQCSQCQQLIARPLWHRIVEYRELIHLSRELLSLVELTRNTAPTLREDAM